MKTFQIHGVADVYEQFDRPDNKDPNIGGRPRILEHVLVSSVTLVMGETAAGTPGWEEAILRYVRIPDQKRKGSLREQGAKGKVVPIQFTATLCTGFQ